MLPSTYRTKVRFNAPIHGRNAGAIEKVKTDENGIIQDLLIRRRLKDNDGSVEILKEENKEPKKTKKTKKELNNG